VLKDLFKALSDTSVQFMTVNRPVLKKALDVTRDSISNVVKDNRINIDDNFAKTPDNPAVQALGFIFNNPVINALAPFNPISILSDAAEQELGDELQFPTSPSLIHIFTTIVPNLIHDELENIIRLFNDIYVKINAMVEGTVTPSDTMEALVVDTLWTVIDAIYELFATFIDIFADVLTACGELFTGVWKIPRLTELWKDFSEGQEFTVLNMMTLPLAMVLNLYSLSVHGKLPFDEHPNLEDELKFTDAELNISNFWGVEDTVDIQPKNKITMDMLPDVEPTTEDEKQEKMVSLFNEEITMPFNVVGSVTADTEMSSAAYVSASDIQQLPQVRFYHP
jgi:hypothetical protein